VITFSNHLSFLAPGEFDEYGIGNGDGHVEVMAPEKTLTDLSAPLVAGPGKSSLLISWIYRFYVGFLALAVAVHMWRDPGRVTKINALMLLIPLTLRFLLVV
jgi:hypothetical protein